jgi:carboxylesterase
LGLRVAYHYWPNASNEQIVLFCRHLRDDLAEIRCPALLMHSRQDKTVNPEMMPLINDQLGSRQKTMVWLENSGHVVTEDYERERVYAMIQEFITARLASTGE